MHYILIYDAGTMSRTPWRAFVFALGLTALPAIIWIWQRAQGEPVEEQCFHVEG